MSPSRVAETLANGLAADQLFCDLLANSTCTSNTRLISTLLSRSGGTSAAAVMPLTDAIEQALPA